MIPKIQQYYSELLAENFSTDPIIEDGVDLKEFTNKILLLAKAFLSSHELTREEYNDLSRSKTELYHFLQSELPYRAAFIKLFNLTRKMLKFEDYRRLTQEQAVAKYAWEEHYEEIKVILNEFDPLGVAEVSEDEYDCCNEIIFEFIKTENDKDKIHKFLLKHFYEHMGMYVNSEEASVVASRLRDLLT